MVEALRVLIIDDHAAVREALASEFGPEPDFEIVGEAQDGAEAIALVERRQADIVLMDIRMPDVDGLEATRRLQRDMPTPPPVLEQTAYYTSLALPAVSGTIAPVSDRT